jgi:hypothetical protein
MKYFITILLLFVVSCSPDFDRPHYRRPLQTGNVWKRKNLPIIRQDTYRDPKIKTEQKRKLIQPKTINLDKW